MNDSQKTDVTPTETLSSQTMDLDLQAILGAAHTNSNTMNDLDTENKSKSKRKEKEWTQFRNKYHQQPLALDMPSRS